MPRARANAIVAVACVLLAAVVFAPSYWLFLATTAAVQAIVVLSVGIMSGRAGLMALCPLTFSAVGAWTVCYLNVYAPAVPLPAGILLGGIAAMPLGFAIGLPALRLRGNVLAIVTLAFALAGDAFLTAHNFPGADVGRGIVRGGLIASDAAFYLFTLAVFGIIASALAFADRTRFGAAWRAVRRKERAATALGLSVPLVKLGAFVIGAFVAGIGGALLVAQAGTAVPRNFAPVGSLLVFALATMTGAEYALGALIAGMLSAFTPELLSRVNLPPDVAQMIFAVGAIQALSSGRSIAGGIMRPRGKVEHQVALDETKLTAPAPAPAGALNGQTPALDVRALRVAYDSVIALDAVTFSVPHLSVTALIGPNGAGKSTLVDAVTGFIERSEGSVSVAGRAFDDFDARKRARSGIRRTFQQGATIPELTIAGYLALAAERPMTYAEIEEVTAFFGLGAPDTPISLIDVGTRRIVEVAGTVVSRPAVVLLDEPAAGLPSSESLALARRIGAIPARFGCTVVVIEHDLAFVRAACRYIVALDFGKVIARGECATVLASPAVIEAYLGPSAEIAS